MFSTWYGYVNFNELAKRTASDKVLIDKAFNVAENPKYNGCERGIAYMVYKFFYKKISGCAIKSMQNQKLANELHKSIIKKF